MAAPFTASNVEPLIGLYRAKKTYIEGWFKRVRNELQVWMEHSPERRIHSIRGRLKDEDHFRDKVVRKGSGWTQDNVFDKVEDFAGMRILTLYRNDLAILDYFIYQSSVWRVLTAEANYDETRHKDDRWFQDLGFKKCEDRDGKGTKCPCISRNDCTNYRRLKKNDRGYSSIHYTLVPGDMSMDHWNQNRHLKCELQIRTIHEEAWGEFSHEFTYPHDATDLLAGELIKRLSGLLHLAEDMVADIRRAPADGRLFQRAHFLARTKASAAPQPTFDSVHELIASSYFMNRSAPLAAMALMTEYTASSNELARGKSIDASRIVSLGFGKLDDSGDGDELARLYLDAHKIWKSANGTREVVKFFVWRPFSGEEFKAPKLFMEFSADIELWLVPQKVHESIVLQIETALGARKASFPNLASFQFFLWSADGGHPPVAASLPRRKELTEEKVIGFFAPYQDADLVAGVLWFKDCGDPVRLILNAYAEILLALRHEDRLLVKIVAGATSAPLSTLTSRQKKMLRKTGESKLRNALLSLGVLNANERPQD